MRLWPVIFLLASPSLVGCCRGLGKERELAERLEESAHSHTSTGRFVNAMCGWDPPLYGDYKADTIDVIATGDAEVGTGEVTATLVTPTGHRCSGRASFHYDKRHPPNRAAYFMISGLGRIGTPPIADEVARVAKPIAFDVATPVAFSGWTTPDGRPAAAYRIEIPAAGRRCFLLGAPFHEAIFTVYQGGAAVIDPGGAVSNLMLAPGPAYVLISSAKGDAATLTVKSTGC
jgi:hypothetical protein